MKTHFQDPTETAMIPVKQEVALKCSAEGKPRDDVPMLSRVSSEANRRFHVARDIFAASLNHWVGRVQIFLFLPSTWVLAGPFKLGLAKSSETWILESTGSCAAAHDGALVMKFDWEPPPKSGGPESPPTSDGHQGVPDKKTSFHL